MKLISSQKKPKPKPKQTPAQTISHQTKKAEPASISPKLPPVKQSIGDTSTESPEKAKTLESAARQATFSEDTFLGLPLQQPTEDERRLVLLKRFIDENWGPQAVNNVFRILYSGGFPPMPPVERWDIPSHFDVERLVWEQVHTEKFIDESWPSIRMLLKDDILNYEWAARVATVLSLFNIIKVIPIVLEDLK